MLVMFHSTDDVQSLFNLIFSNQLLVFRPWAHLTSGPATTLLAQQQPSVGRWVQLVVSGKSPLDGLGVRRTAQVRAVKEQCAAVAQQRQHLAERHAEAARAKDRLRQELNAYGPSKGGCSIS